MKTRCRWRRELRCSTTSLSRCTNCATILIFYAVPYDKIVAQVCPEAKLRKLVKNMVYVGVVANLLTIDMGEVEKAIRKQFAKKVKAANLNLAAAQAGFEYAKANLEKRGAFYIERMDKTAGKIIIDGNSAAALGCMFAGCTVVTWYPITPSSSLVETMIEYMKEYRIGPDGKATFAIVQAEDELAAIGMVIGAGWAGARSMTATAGPGISLMAEFAGLAYYVEVPGVIWDIQRVGPSTGLTDAHVAGRHSVDCGLVPRRHEAHHADSLLRRGVLHHGDGGLQSGRAIPDAGVRHVGSRSRNEQLDVGSVPVSRRLRSSAARFWARKIWNASADLHVTKMSTATGSATAHCPARRIRQRRISLAAAATTRRRNTASAPTISKTTWSA